MDNHRDFQIGDWLLSRGRVYLGRVVDIRSGKIIVRWVDPCDPDPIFLRQVDGLIDWKYEQSLRIFLHPMEPNEEDKLLWLTADVSR